MSENDESPTFSASEQVDRINRRKKKQLENIDMTRPTEEQNAFSDSRKKCEDNPEIQGREAEDDPKYDPESEDLENYPIVEGKKRTPRAKRVESDEEKSPLQ